MVGLLLNPTPFPQYYKSFVLLTCISFSDIEEIFIARFGRWNEVVAELDADEEYRKNYEKMNPDRLFEDEISNNESVRTMIYFEQSDKFKAWLESQQKTENGDFSPTAIRNSVTILNGPGRGP